MQLVIWDKAERLKPDYLALSMKDADIFSNLLTGTACNNIEVQYK